MADIIAAFIRLVGGAYARRLLLVIFGSLAVMPAVKAADAVADFDSAGLAKAATFFGVLALEVLAIRWLLAKLWLWQVTR